MGNEQSVVAGGKSLPEYRGGMVEKLADEEVDEGVTELDRRLDAMDVIDESGAFVAAGIGDEIEGQANIPSREEIPGGESSVEASARLVDEVLEAIARQTGMKPETILKAREDCLE